MSVAGRAAFLDRYTLTKAATAYDEVLSSLSIGGPGRFTQRTAVR